MGLFSQAIDAGYRRPEVYLRRALIRRWENDDDGASQDAIEVLQSDHAELAQVERALTMIAPEQLPRIVELPAVAMLSPSEQAWIADRLKRSRDEAETARLMLLPLLSDSRLVSEEQPQARRALVLVSIALGLFSEALEVIRSQEPELERMEIDFAFNYGVALWGDRRQLVRDPFKRVVELEQSDPDDNGSPNRLQCISLSHWACGDAGAAREYATAAHREITRRRGSEFSCWRYLRVPAAEFAQDVSEMIKLIDGNDSVTPRFLSQT